MTPKKIPLPTTTELEILEVLWRDGKATVRDIYEELERRRPMGYTSILKLLQIMHGKGLVARDESSRTHVYRAAVVQRDTQERLVDDLMSRAFGGSAAELVMRALDTKPASEAERQQIRALLDRLEKQR